MIPHCSLSCLFSDFSFYVSYIVSAASHTLNEEVLPSRFLQSFQKYIPSCIGLTARRKEEEKVLFIARSPPILPPDLSLVLLEIWTQTKVAYSILGTIRQLLA